MRRRPSTRVVFASILVVALVVAGIVSFYASRSPDGLNRVAIGRGIDGKQSATKDSPLSGYQVKGVHNARLSRGLSGVAGALIVLTLAGGLTYAVRRRTPHDSEGAS